MNDPIRRALRSFIQGFIAILIVSPAYQALAAGTVDLSALRRVLVAATGAGATAVLSFAQNYLEDSTGKAFGVSKATADPEPTAGTGALQPNPEPDPVLGTEVPPGV